MNIAERFIYYIIHHPRSLLCLFCALLFIHIGFAFCGFYGNDDINYANYAAAVWHKTYAAGNYCDHFGLRWAPIFTTAFFYKLIGVNAVSSALFSVLAIVAAAFVIYLFIRKENFYIQLLTWILFFWNYSIVFYSHRLLPDVGFCAFNFIAYYFYYRQLVSLNKTILLNAVLWAVFLMLMMLTKETVIIIFPFWLLLLVIDLFKKRNLSFWVSASVTLIVLIFFYLLYFKIFYNDWFYRYNLLQSDSLAGGSTYSQFPVVETFKRIGYHLWEAFLLNGDMEYLLFAVCGLIYHKTILKRQVKTILYSAFLFYCFAAIL